MAEPNDLFGIPDILWTEQQNIHGNLTELNNVESTIPTPPPKEVKKRGSGKGSKAQPKKRKIERQNVPQRRVHCTVVNCNYSTPHPKDLTRHMRKHTGEKPFNCDLCSKSFSRYDKLIVHKKSHQGIRAFQCTFCEHAALDAGSLRKHTRTHSDERPYICQMCPYRARDSSQLVVHLRHHTGDCPYICSEKNCKASFKTPSDLQRHRRSHSGEKPYPCPHCEYRANVKSNLNAHIKRHLNRGVTSTSIPPESQVTGSGVDNSQMGSYTTNTTATTTTTLEQLLEQNGDNEIHQPSQPQPQSNSGEERELRFPCKLCEYKGETIKHFQSHMRRKHKKTQALALESQLTKPPKKRPLNALPKQFSCSTCSAEFVREDSLRCHMRQHAALGPPPMPLIPPITDNNSYTLPTNEIQQVQVPSQNFPGPPPPYVSSASPIPYQPQQEYTNFTNLDHQVDELPVLNNINICERPQVITYAERNNYTDTFNLDSF